MAKSFPFLEKSADERGHGTFSKEALSLQHGPSCKHYFC